MKHLKVSCNIKPRHDFATACHSAVIKSNRLQQCYNVQFVKVEQMLWFVFYPIPPQKPRRPALRTYSCDGYQTTWLEYLKRLQEKAPWVAQVLNYVRQNDHIKGSEARGARLQSASAHKIAAKICVCRLGGVNRIFQSGYIKTIPFGLLKHVAMTRTDLKKTHACYASLLFFSDVGAQIFELQSCGTIL